MVRVLVGALQSFFVSTCQVRNHQGHFGIAVFTSHVIGWSHILRVGANGTEEKEKYNKGFHEIGVMLTGTSGTYVLFTREFPTRTLYTSKKVNGKMRIILLQEYFPGAKGAIYDASSPFETAFRDVRFRVRACRIRTPDLSQIARFEGSGDGTFLVR